MLRLHIYALISDFFAFSESHPTVTRYTFYTMPFLYCNLHLTNIRLCNAFLLFKLA